MRTGHAEVVLVAFDIAATSFQELLRLFWEGHDPTQGMRQGNDVGSQYRSAIYWQDESQRISAVASRDAYQQVLTAAGYGAITTEIEPGGPAHPFLLRRGLPPAVPREEPRRVLRIGRHRSQLSRGPRRERLRPGPHVWQHSHLTSGSSFLARTQ